jgi:hypothetical protein
VTAGALLDGINDRTGGVPLVDTPPVAFLGPVNLIENISIGQSMARTIELMQDLFGHTLAQLTGVC